MGNPTTNDVNSIMLKRARSIIQTGLIVLFLTALFLIVLWDMQKVHQISEIIHNDHSGLWERMNDSAAKQWLTPLDLCMLKIKDQAIDIKSYRNKNCSKVSTILDQSIFAPIVKSNVNNMNYLKYTCSIGSSVGKACPAPLSTRSYFTYRLKDPRYQNFDNKNLIFTLKRLALKNMPLLFIGDGLSKQNYEALICDSLRTSKVYVTSPSVGKNETNKLLSEYIINWKENKSLKLSVYYYRLVTVTEELEHRRNRKALRERRNLSTSATSVVNFNQSLIEDPVLSNSTVDSTTNRFDELQTIIEHFMKKNHSLVIIANLGVWYNSREKFRKEMPLFLTWLNEIGKSEDHNNLVFYRETAAQHWNHTESGYFDYEYRDHSENNGSCVQIADASPELDWRNIDVENIISNEDYDQIKVIPFYKLTMPLYNMHPTSDHQRDCTHYCYFPQMWQPIWFHLHNTTSQLD